MPLVVWNVVLVRGLVQTRDSLAAPWDFQIEQIALVVVDRANLFAAVFREALAQVVVELIDDLLDDLAVLVVLERELGELVKSTPHSAAHVFYRVNRNQVNGIRNFHQTKLLDLSARVERVRYRVSRAVHGPVLDHLHHRVRELLRVVQRSLNCVVPLLQAGDERARARRAQVDQRRLIR